MLTIKCCTELTEDVIFETFKQGFSDYFIQLDMTQPFFIEYFFGAEGNTKDMSFVAYEGDKPVGVLLGGIRENSGIKTLRCGGMAVLPKARKKGIAKKMMAEHEALGRAAGVHQLFLEVLTINERAYKLYESLGYEKVYDLTYRNFTPASDYFVEVPEDFIEDKEAFFSVQKITLTDLEALRQIDESHLPWQGSIDCVKNLPVEVFGVFKNGQLIAGLIGDQKHLYYIYVLPAHRLLGIGKALLAAYIKECGVESCRFVYTNNARLHTFANHLKMTTGEFGQYEYYKWLE